MKSKQITVHLLLSAWILLLLSPILSAQTSDKIIKTNDLTIKVTGLKSDKGGVVIKLFNSKESYNLKGAKAYREISTMIKDYKTEVHFPSLAPSEYAIKLFHDENSNGIHDKNFIGLPKEDYAFSNNAVGTMGPPDYEKAKFQLNNNLIITINISKAKEVK